MTTDQTAIRSEALQDKRLSWKARGLLSYLLSQGPGHQTSIRTLAKFAPDGKGAVETGVLELERLGYLTRRQSREGGNSYAGTDYIVQDTPQVTD